MKNKLQILIDQGESLTSSIRQSAWGTYYINRVEEYQTWVDDTQEFLEEYYPDQVVEPDETAKGTSFSISLHSDLINTLNLLQGLPLATILAPEKQIPQLDEIATVSKPKAPKAEPVKAEQAKTQPQAKVQTPPPIPVPTQTVLFGDTPSQLQIFEIFLESINDELTGRQQKEIKAILEAFKNKPEQARDQVLAKLKELGIDVVTNILANIITNPTISGGMLGK